MKYRKCVNHCQESVFPDTPGCDETLCQSMRRPGCRSSHGSSSRVQRTTFFLLMALTLIFPTGWGSICSSQDFEEEPVTVTGKAAGQFPVGGTTQLVLTMSIGKEFYVYQDQVKLALKESPGFQPGEPVLPEAVKKYDRVMEKEVPIYQGTLNMQLPVQSTAEVAPGETVLVALVTYQACTESYCLMPTTVEVPVTVTIARNGGDSAVAGIADMMQVDADRRSVGKENGEALSVEQTGDETVAAGSESRADLLKKSLEEGDFALALVMIFLGGVLASLTPCVYPMIPITITVIGAKSAGGKLKGFILSLFYVLGIAITYSILGIAAAKTGALFGAALQNSWVVGGIATLFFVLGLSMLGAFELQVPSSLSTRMNAYQGKGYLGVLIMGAITGVVASPCVGPIIVVLLAFVAQTQSILIGFSFLFTFALGMGVLFILIGTFSGILVNLPRSGNWMVMVKNLFGVVMIGVAFFYLKTLIPEWVFAPLLGAYLCLVGLVTGWPPKRSETDETGSPGSIWMLGIRRTIGVCGISIGIYLVLGTLVIHGFVLPPVSLTSIGGGTSISEIEWLSNEEEALNAALKTGQPLMIDFTADWCAKCKELDKFTYTNPAVQSELKRFVSAKIDFTDSSPEVERLTQKYGVVGLPLIVFFNSEGDEMKDLRVTGFMDGDEMLELLRSVP